LGHGRHAQGEKSAATVGDGGQVLVCCGAITKPWCGYPLCGCKWFVSLA
jgi:hypothetical protein